LSIEVPHPPATVNAALDALEAAGRLVRDYERVYAAEFAEQGRALLLGAVDAFHAEHPLEPGIDREALRRALPEMARAGLGDWILDRLLAEGTLEGRGGAVARAGFRASLAPDQAQARDRLLSIFTQGGFTPP